MDVHAMPATRFVLELIRDAEGQLDWAQIDAKVRAEPALEGTPIAVKFLGELAAHGLVRADPHKLLNNAKYWLTDAGRAALAGPAAVASPAAVAPGA
jgi:hypothetical protein